VYGERGGQCQEKTLLHIIGGEMGFYTVKKNRLPKKRIKVIHYKIEKRRLLTIKKEIVYS